MDPSVSCLSFYNKLTNQSSIQQYISKIEYVNIPHLAATERDGFEMKFVASLSARPQYETEALSLVIPAVNIKE